MHRRVDGASRPYRPRRPSPLSPYAAAWREYAWRLRCAHLLFAFWLGLLIFLALRFRTWILFVMFPAPLKAACLRSFRCPRCGEAFGVSEDSGWWNAARINRCLHCGLDKGVPADPDDLSPPASRSG